MNGSLFLRHFMGSNFFGKVLRGNSILGLNGKAGHPDVVVQPPRDVHILLILSKWVPLRRCNAFCYSLCELLPDSLGNGKPPSYKDELEEQKYGKSKVWRLLILLLVVDQLLLRHNCQRKEGYDSKHYNLEIFSDDSLLDSSKYAHLGGMVRPACRCRALGALHTAEPFQDGLERHSPAG